MQRPENRDTRGKALLVSGGSPADVHGCMSLLTVRGRRVGRIEERSASAPAEERVERLVAAFRSLTALRLIRPTLCRSSPRRTESWSWGDETLAIAWYPSQTNSPCAFRANQQVALVVVRSVGGQANDCSQVGA